MLGRSTGSVLVGVEARLIQVEVDLGRGLPTIAAIGLPDAAVREGIDRIRSALRHSGFDLPQRRVTINLAPAEVRKHGSALDLPIAVALLVADGRLPSSVAEGALIVGELALDGSLRPVRGALAAAMAASASGCRRVLVPRANADEAALVPDLDVVPLNGLADVAALVRGHRAERPEVDVARLLEQAGVKGDGDLADVRGQAGARRALEIAAAGGHHLLLCGPPGAGKTMLARRLPGILPPLSADEALEVTRVWSAAGLARGLVACRPFRAPHHGISFAGLTGGGSRIRPGEISLATRGVLYLDELPEFRRDALEALRQPLEEGRITIVRANEAATIPAAFALVASRNPCPCGYHGAPDGRCGCTPGQVQRYRARVSGPLLDRFDLVVDVPAMELAAIASRRPGESSARVRDRVVAARLRQRARLGRHGAACNARMTTRDLEAHAAIDRASRRRLERAWQRSAFSARRFDRVRRVARTIADLEGAERILDRHVAEAVQSFASGPRVR